MYAVFNVHNTVTYRYYDNKEDAVAFCNKTPNTDYEKAEHGYYVCRDDVPVIRYDTQAQAVRFCAAENMATDNHTYTVIPWF